MHIVTLQESDLKILQDRFSHLDTISDYYESMETLVEYFTKHLSSEYEISEYLGIAYGFIDGHRQLFMYGNGYALKGVFGHKRVYG